MVKTGAHVGRRDADRGVLFMAKEMEIVFFGDLGFGWMLETEQVERIRDKEALEQILIRHSLAELFRKTKPI